MKTIIHSFLALAVLLMLAGCAGAAFNRVDFTMSRNITVGQELMDLQAAHEKGVISDEEYIAAKKNILNILGQLGELKD